MADFCRWGTTIPKTVRIGRRAFLEAHCRSIGQTSDVAVQAHPVALVMMALMAEKTDWMRTSAKLLEDLGEMAEEERIDTGARTWPKAAPILARRLREATTDPQEAGAEVLPPGRTHREAAVDWPARGLGKQRHHRHQRQRPGSPEHPRVAMCDATPLAAGSGPGSVTTWKGS